MSDEFTKLTGMTQAEYMKQNGSQVVTFKTLMDAIGVVADEIVALESKDANALLESAALKRLESQSLAVRDHCTALTYSRTEVEAPAGKELPVWLR